MTIVIDPTYTTEDENTFGKDTAHKSYMTNFLDTLLSLQKKSQFYVQNINKIIKPCRSCSRK